MRPFRSTSAMSRPSQTEGSASANKSPSSGCGEEPRSLLSRLRIGVNLLGVVGLATLSATASGCLKFDTERPKFERGTLGEEVFGVVCSRVSAQALREDLSGESVRNLCRKPTSGQYATTVDESKLPPIAEGLRDESGNLVPVATQREARTQAIRRIEALARRRPDVIRAIDAAFPGDLKVAIKDLNNPDPKQSCAAPSTGAEARLVDQLADFLGRMGGLYTDGTIPLSTQALARIIDTFNKDAAAQDALQRISARQGYRPVDTSLGVVRPLVTYPNLRDFANASLRLLSSNSKPYDPSPKRTPDGTPIPTPGPANAAFNKLLDVVHEELLTAKPSDPLVPLTEKLDPSGRVVLSRPREPLELADALALVENDAFSVGAPRYVTRRDARGYARIRGGAVPTPLVDADQDGLPDLDDVGRFKTSNGAIVPSPFAFPFGPEATRDEFGRLVAKDGLVFEYVDTSRIFAAQVTKDLRPLINSDPSAKRETLMDLVGGLQIAMGPRELTSKQYDQKKIEYYGVRTSESPALDLVHALGVILGDKNSDALLALGKELFTSKLSAVARTTGAVNNALDLVDKHPEATLPKTSTYVDGTLEILGEIAQVPGLLEDILRAVATPETLQLVNTFTKYASFKDELTYNSNNVNGPAYNISTNSLGEAKTPVDRSKPYTGKNRSILHRFLALMSDTQGVTTCNRPGARVHASLGLINVTMPLFGSYGECEVFKIENLGVFYANVIGEGWRYDAASKPNKRGAMYLRDDRLREGGPLFGLGAASTDLIQNSSGLTGFADTGNNRDLTPTPRFLNRLVFFDTLNDSPNPGELNYKTNRFIHDLAGDFIGSSVCPERVIDDPVPDAIDASPDGKIRGLRSCAQGQWLEQRNPNTIFALEQFGFYDSVKPLLRAFLKRGREDLFVKLSASTYKYYPGKEATDAECRLPGNKTCPRDGLSSHEGLLVDALMSDLVPALHELVKMLDTMSIKTCASTDATGACTIAGTKTQTGVDILAQAARAALDPAYSKSIKLTDRNGKATALRNDGTELPQVTPIYLVRNAIRAVDTAFDKYDAEHPEDKERRAGWERARSQLFDQFLGIQGEKATSSFVNPTIPTMAPKVIDLVRSQLWAHCPKSFVPPFERCDWARDQLVKNSEDMLVGPIPMTGLDIVEAIRKDPDARREAQRMLEYMLDPASKNDALANVLATAVEAIQLLKDEKNTLPLYKVLAEAVDASTFENGKIVKKSFVDAQLDLLARLNGKYIDESGVQICRNEVDPNQLLTTVVGRLVTPITDGSFKGEAPVEVLLDVIADVNRQNPTPTYDRTLDRKDYAYVGQNIVEFLTDRESGLEQLYEIIRQGTLR
jgi:hypothetical protein